MNKSHRPRARRRGVRGARPPRGQPRFRRASRRAQTAPATSHTPDLLASPKVTDVVNAATPSWPRSRMNSERSPRSNSSRNSPSGGRTFQVDPMCAMVLFTATSSPNRPRRP